MSTITIGDKISTINEIDSQQPQNHILSEKIMKYKNLDDDFNMVSLKSRYTFQKITSLMEENKDENINLDEFNDPKNEEYKNNIMKKKIIQYYCTNKNDKNEFIPPSEGIMKKIRQFKKWQKYEIFQKDGFKNYLNNLMPDYKLVHKTRNLIENKVNLFTKIKIIPPNNNLNNISNNSLTLLPKINNNNYSNIEKEKENDNESNIFHDISRNYKNKLIKNKSMDSIIKSSSLINLLDDSKKIKHKNKFDNSKEIKSFEDSIFCLNKSLIPMSRDKSIMTTPFGGGLLHCNSLMRNKSVSNLCPYYPTKRIQEKLKDYKNKRSKVIHNKDYIYHIGNFDHTFITNKKNYDYSDYYIF